MRVILTIEDDGAIRRGIVDALRFVGFQAIEAGSGEVGMELALRKDYDLLLLDLVLPGIQGIEILRQVRQARPTQPVIILTARGDERDRVEGLRLGADDYVVKPFSVHELMARIEAVLRRSPARPSSVTTYELPVGRLVFSRREIVFHDGMREELTERETDLLQYLAQHVGRAIGRDELLANVWRIEPRGISTRTIDMLVARLREKLRDNSAEPRILLTVRGKGYMLANETQGIEIKAPSP